MPTAFTPRDQPARERIINSLDETLFVEAGAGTGKTTSLVGRIVSLISRGKTTIERIAAITFTEAAASELRDRVRQELEESASDPDKDEAERQRCKRGVEDIDQASIQTLHSFSTAILRERPLEAGLPPSFEVMDEVAGSLSFAEKWTDWIGNALTDESVIPTLPMSLALGLTTNHLREIAVKFHENYDLLAAAKFEDSPFMPQAVRELVDAQDELERLCEFSKMGEGDALYDHVQDKLASIRRLAALDDYDSPTAYFQLRNVMPVRQGRGRQTDWNTDPETGRNACAVLKVLLTDLNATVSDELERARTSALMPILAALRDFALDYAGERKRQGRVHFHDMLVFARDLLVKDFDVRDHFRERFTHLLIDESQDTDPIQAEIAMCIAESVQPGERRQTDWERMTPEDGKLFVVGDPKQAIYRFRRADVRQMQNLRVRMGGDTVRLVQNFRSHRPIIEWVNIAFAEWMDPYGEYSSGYQADYEPLVHRWDVVADHDRAPSVWALGGEMEGNIGPIREREAAEIAALLGEVRDGKWQVRDESDGDAPTYRPARYSDICVLMPSRTGLPTLEIALEDANVPYRLEGSSLVFATQEVRDLLNCLKAIDDPSDEISIVAALRSPAFARSDVDLLRYFEAGGRFDYLRPGGRSDAAQEPVAKSLTVLYDYHERRLWTSISALTDEFVRDRPLMSAAVGYRRTREQWRRYRFVIDRARAFADAGGNSLREFIEWMETQMSENPRVTEMPVPESDEESVRVMTVHGSKGLEFPVVLLTGISGSRRNTADTALFDRERGPNETGVEVRVGSSGSYHQTDGYDDLAGREKELNSDENIRLLYVAATRAKDHLIVSMFRSGPKSPAGELADILGSNGPANETKNVRGEDVDSGAAIATDADGILWHPAPEPVQAAPYDAADEATRSSNADSVDRAAHSIEARDAWIAERERTVAERSRPISVAATRLKQAADDARLDDDADDDKPDPDDADQPWRRGRAGTSVGRAVHAVLQTVDLETGDGVEETAGAQASAEGIPRRESDIARLARVAIESDVVRRAVKSGRYWREVPVGVPVSDGALEGFIDLLFETPSGGLVIVDYKTDTLREDQTAEAAERYRPQASAYALAVSRATNKPVEEVVFLFLEPKGEESFTDIEALTGEAERMAKSYLAG